MNFFAYSPGSGFNLCDSLPEAKAAAESALEVYGNTASDSGWDEEVTTICYGALRGEVVEAVRKPWGQHLIEDCGWDADEVEDAAPHEFDEYVDYAIEDVPVTTGEIWNVGEALGKPPAKEGHPVVAS